MRMTLEGLEPDSFYFVQLRTKYRGATSLWSRRFDLETLKDTLKPAPVTDLAGSFNEGNLSLSWTAPTTNEDGSPLHDLKDYVVTIYPLPADAEWPPAVLFAEGERASFTKEDNSAAFGRYRTGLRITVQARDIVGNLSEPVEITKAKAKPKPPTNLTWVAVDNSFRGTWTAPTQNLDNSAYTDGDGYQLTVVYVGDNGVRNELVRVEPSTAFTFSYEENKAAFGGPSLTPKARGKLTLEVRARDSVGQLSEPAVATAQDTPPGPPTGVTAKGILNGVRLEWNASPQADSVSHYEIWVAPNATAIGTMATRVYGTFYIYDTAGYDTDFYFYVKAVDNFDLVSEPGRPDPYVAVRPLSPYGVDAEPPATPTGTITVEPYSTAADDPASIRVSWPAVTSSDLAGYHVAYSLDTNPRVWNYRDVVDPADTSVIVTPLRPVTRYIAKVRSYDRSINVSPWSAEVAGMSSDSTSDFVFEDIASDISIITGGSLRSENFVEADPTAVPPVEGQGWRLMPSLLNIESGRVNARVISAGELRSSKTVPVGEGQADEGQPLWNLNLDGNLTVRNARIRGQLFVGADDLDASRVSIASHNYGLHAGNQWAIRGDGTFDIRGSGATGGRLQVTHGGIFGYDANNNQRVVINNQGQFSFQTTNGGLVFDDNGLRLFSGSTLSVELNRLGTAYFRGQIDAASGKIAGWGITPSEIISGSLSLRSDLSQITVGSGTTRAGMRSGYGFWAGTDDPFTVLPPFAVTGDGSLRATKGRIAGFLIAGNALASGDNSTRVQMEAGMGIWTGATNRDAAATIMYPHGLFRSLNASITGEIRATRFYSNGSSAGSGNYIAMGNTGFNDPVDEIRFFHAGTKASLRNPSIEPGSMVVSVNSGQTYFFSSFGGFRTNRAQINTEGGALYLLGGSVFGATLIHSQATTATRIGMGYAGFDLHIGQNGGRFSFNATDSTHGTLRYGQAALKWLSTKNYVQVRNYFDSAYGYIQAYVATPSSEQFKRNIELWQGNALEKINAAPVREWNRVVGAAPPGLMGSHDGEILSEYKVIGPVLEEMPDEVRPDGSMDAYDVSAAIGLLWKAVQELDAKKVDLPTPEPVAPPV